MKLSDNVSVVSYGNNGLALFENGILLAIYKISPYADIVQNGDLSKDIIKAYEDYYNNINKQISRNRK